MRICLFSVCSFKKDWYGKKYGKIQKEQGDVIEQEKKHNG
jgi:hypothetical protein